MCSILEACHCNCYREKEWKRGCKASIYGKKTTSKACQSRLKFETVLKCVFFGMPQDPQDPKGPPKRPPMTTESTRWSTINKHQEYRASIMLYHICNFGTVLLLYLWNIIIVSNYLFIIIIIQSCLVHILMILDLWPIFQHNCMNLSIAVGEIFVRDEKNIWRLDKFLLLACFLWGYFNIFLIEMPLLEIINRNALLRNIKYLFKKWPA